MNQQLFTAFNGCDQWLTNTASLSFESSALSSPLLK